MANHATEIGRIDAAHQAQIDALAQQIVDLRVEMHVAHTRLDAGLEEQRRIVGREGARNLGDVNADVEALQANYSRLHRERANLQNTIDLAIRDVRNEWATAQASIQQALASIQNSANVQNLTSLQETLARLTDRIMALESQSTALRANGEPAPAAGAAAFGAAVAVQGQVIEQVQQAVVQDVIQAVVDTLREDLEKQLETIRDQVRTNKIANEKALGDARSRLDSHRDILRMTLKIEDNSEVISEDLVQAWSTFLQNGTVVPPTHSRQLMDAMVAAISAAPGVPRSQALAALLLILQAIVQLNTIQHINPGVQHIGDGGAASARSSIMQVDNVRKRTLDSIGGLSEAEVLQITDRADDSVVDPTIGRIDPGSALVAVEPSDGRGRTATRTSDAGGREAKRSRSVSVAGGMARAALSGISMMGSALSSWVSPTTRPPAPAAPLDDAHDEAAALFDILGHDLAVDDGDTRRRDDAAENSDSDSAVDGEGDVRPNVFFGPHERPDEVSRVPGRSNAAPRARPVTLNPQQRAARNSYNQDLINVDKVQENVKKLKLELLNEQNPRKYTARERIHNVESDRLTQLLRQMMAHSTAALIPPSQVNIDLDATRAARLATEARLAPTNPRRVRPPPNMMPADVMGAAGGPVTSSRSPRRPNPAAAAAARFSSRSRSPSRRDLPENLRLRLPEGFMSGADDMQDMEDRDGEDPNPTDRMEDVDCGNGDVPQGRTPRQRRQREIYSAGKGGLERKELERYERYPRG